MKCIYWMRQDLRIQDNEVFRWASEQSGDILIVYSIPSDFREWSPQRRSFLKQTLDDLKTSLKKFNLDLHITSRSIIDLLPGLFQLQKWTHLLYSKEHAYNELRDEKKVRELAENAGLEVESFDQSTLMKESNLPFSINKLPKIFTDYKKLVEPNLQINPLHDLTKIELKSISMAKEEIDWGDLLFHPWFEGGETSGLKRIKTYTWDTQSVLHYEETRNGMINLNDSSKLSPWLALGAISTRRIFHEVKKFEFEKGENKSCYWLIYEILWRDYFKFYAKKYGARIFNINGIQDHQKKIFIDDHEIFHQWSQGETGEPFIDAHMKELLVTGWMSNRGRQNVSNYLAKTLKINWTWGAIWFEKNLIDYDPCQNWGNWNYTAGVGADPRDRLFNPKSQAKAYDPDATYQMKWLNQRNTNG